MAEIPCSLFHPLGSEHDPDYRTLTLHHGCLALHNIAKSRGSACRLHCSVSGPQLGSDGVLCSFASSIQDLAVSSPVHCMVNKLATCASLTRVQIGPFFNWLYMVYGIFTAGRRTWGGPRADAGEADEVMSPRDVIEYAEKIGDDLNIIPETFRPAAEARFEGASSAPYSRSQLPRGFDDRLTHSAPRPYWEGITGSSAIPLRDGLARSATLPHFPLHPRASMSMESLASACSVDQLAGGERRQSDVSADLEAASLYGSPRSHPPLAPSAHFTC